MTQAAQALQNAKQFPIMCYARHMETGLVGYENETILFSAEDMKNMIPTFVGKPVYVHHQDVDLKNLKEQAHGYVVESFYNELDGWLWAKMLLVDDDAVQAVANNWSVSNAYIPTEWGDGGMHHNLPYTRKIVNGEFTHLALVPNPRYENAKIYSPDEFKIYQAGARAKLDELHNSLPENDQQKGNPMFKLFKTTTTKEEVKNADADTVIEFKNDAGEMQELKVGDMIAAVLNAKKNSDKETEKEEEKTNMDMMVKVGDEDMPLRELMNRYQAMNAKKNESADEDEEADEDLENSLTPEEVAAQAAAEKKNAGKDHFKELKNAHNNASSEVQIVDLGNNQLARGKQRYGSGN